VNFSATEHQALIRPLFFYRYIIIKVKTMSRYTSKATNPFDSDSDTEIEVARNSTQPSSGSTSYGASFGGNKAQYKNDFRDSGGIQNQSTQELEGYVVCKAEETTQKVNDCVRIAEEMREGASNTLVQLHQQGQQIERTHLTAVDIDQDLSRVCFPNISYFLFFIITTTFSKFKFSIYTYL
jgi:hypothetical protein